MRTIQDRIDAIQAEISSIGKDMGGINPKLSLYAKLQERMDGLNRELQELRASRGVNMNEALTGGKVLQ